MGREEQKPEILHYLWAGDQSVISSIHDGLRRQSSVPHLKRRDDGCGLSHSDIGDILLCSAMGTENCSCGERRWQPPPIDAYP